MYEVGGGAERLAEIGLRLARRRHGPCNGTAEHEACERNQHARMNGTRGAKKGAAHPRRNPRPETVDHRGAPSLVRARNLRGLDYRTIAGPRILVSAVG